MNNRTLLLIIASICFISSSSINIAKAADVVAEDETKYECPKDHAFVTTCTGSSDDGGGAVAVAADAGADEVDDEAIYFEEVAREALQDDLSSHEQFSNDGVHDDDFDDLVDEVLEESVKEETFQQQQQPPPSTNKQSSSFEQQQQNAFTSNSNSNNSNQNDYCDADPDLATTAMQQLKHQITTLTHKYYDPLPEKGKCAIGTVCGFAASRITMGVANRVFRLVGATWVAAEVLHTSGFCDESKCVPSEMRPWIGILHRALVKQCVKVRLIARRVWDQDRIRELAQNHKQFSGGFASGAFIGFVV